METEKQGVGASLSKYVVKPEEKNESEFNSGDFQEESERKRRAEKRHQELKEELEKLKLAGEKRLLYEARKRIDIPKEEERQKEVKKRIVYNERHIDREKIPPKVNKRLEDDFKSRIALEKRKLDKEIESNKYFNREKLSLEKQITRKLQTQEGVLRQQIKQQRTGERMDWLEDRERRRRRSGSIKGF